MSRSKGSEQLFGAEAALRVDFTQDPASADATLGWIVITCVAVMVIGLGAALARRFSSAGRQRLKEEGPGGRAGRWLMFMSVMLLVIGTASFVAERRTPGVAGGNPLAAVGLVALGVLLFVAGAWATAVARRRAELYRYGVSGEAMIRDMRRTRTVVNYHSTFEFDLDVSGSSFPPVRVTHRDVIPMWVGERVERGTTVPVKVDPSSPARLVFDWDRFDDARERFG